MKSTLRPYPLDRLVRSRMTRLVVALMAWTVAVGAVPVGKAEDVGLSSERLQRINQVIQRYIDDKQITGAVTVVHAPRPHRALRGAGPDGRRSQDADAQGRHLPHGVDDQAGHRRRDPDAARGGQGPPDRSGVAVHSRIQGREGGDREVIARRCDGGGAAAAGQPPRRRRSTPCRPAATSRCAICSPTPRDSRAAAPARGKAPASRPRGANDTLAGYIPKLGAVPLDFQPGSEWRYSGLAGIETLGRIVEVASGLTFDVFLKQRIFDPLGMKDTAFYPADDEPAAGGDALRPDAGRPQAPGDARLAGDQDAVLRRRRTVVHRGGLPAVRADAGQRRRAERQAAARARGRSI